MKTFLIFILITSSIFAIYGGAAFHGELASYGQYTNGAGQ